MRKAEVESLIRRRYRISKREAQQEALGLHPDVHIIDYHSGCMGVLACLLSDLYEKKRTKTRKRRTRK